jgi:hypothetical protein
VDGMNLYEAFGGSPFEFNDPFGKYLAVISVGKEYAIQDAQKENISINADEIIGERHFLPDLSVQSEQYLAAQMNKALREAQKEANKRGEYLDIGFEGHSSEDARKVFRLVLKEIQNEYAKELEKIEDIIQKEEAKKNSFKVRTLTFAYCRSDRYEKIDFDDPDWRLGWDWYFSDLKVDQVIVADIPIVPSVENMSPGWRTTETGEIKIYSTPDNAISIPISKDKRFNLVEYLEKLGRQKK